ncbi:MAG TPA: fimbrillin family protein, partial [Bacillaceae bacterium]
MNGQRLLMTMIAGAMLIAACSNDRVKENDEAKESVGQTHAIAEEDTYERLARLKNDELDSAPLEMTSYAGIVDADLHKPSRTRFAVNSKFTISGSVKKHDQLKSTHAWIKVRLKESSNRHDEMDYYAKLNNGRFKQSVQLFNGEGAYEIQVLLPSTDKEDYYTELAA